MARGTARVVQQASREVRPTTLQLGVGMVVVAVLAKLAMLVSGLRMGHESLDGAINGRGVVGGGGRAGQARHARECQGLVRRQYDESKETQRMAQRALAPTTFRRQYDESKETERVARRARRFAEEQEELEAMSREEWDAVKAARPQTPYESALTRSGARIRTGSWPSVGEAYNWASVVLTDAMKRVESSEKSR
ncbi:unnamed protein product [Closterium sp. Naga37s-1]|nr:unnamed protein product [Closterium sp. Naga37s-1]